MAASLVAKSGAVLSRSTFLGAETSPVQGAGTRPAVASPSGLVVKAKKGGRSAAKKAFAAVAAVAVAAPVVAAEPDAVQAAGLKVEDVQAALVQAQSASQQVIAGAKVGYETAVDVFDKVLQVVMPAVEAAAPVVQDAAQQAVKIASPYANSLTAEAQKALVSAGVDTKQVTDVVKVAAEAAGSAAAQATSAATAAAPAAQSTLDTVLASDPVILAGGAGALVLLYLAAPAIAGSLAQKARGYRGDLTAAQALDLLGSEDYTLIDLRTEKEKARSGIPALPRGAQKKLLTVPNEEFEDRKLRGQLRNAKNVETTVTAIKISSLKRLGRGSSVILIDAYGDVSRQVARALTGMGFKQVYVLKDGFDGRTGWVNSKLSTDSYDVRTTEILSPSRVLSPGTTFTRSSRPGTSRKILEAEVLRSPNKKLLPGN